MSAPTIAPYRSTQPVGRDGFAQLVRAEWTKLRTVRGWVAGLVLVIVLTDLMGLFAAGSAHIACLKGPGSTPQTGKACQLTMATGPGGEAVTDSYHLVGQPLGGNGSLTTRVTSLTTEWGVGNGPDAGSQLKPGPVPWAKAGLIITASTRPGSAYAAMLVTPGHGVRLQYNYTGDVPGLPGRVAAATPRWLRLTRSGDLITGYDSADGTHWTRVGAVRLAGLPPTVRAGLFVTAPGWQTAGTSFGGSQGSGGPSLATATIDQVGRSRGWAGGPWRGTVIGDRGLAGPGYQQDGGRFTIRGSGDIAPSSPSNGTRAQTIEQHLVGVFAGLIAAIVVAVMFITTEYRRGLIRTTLMASPRRGRVLAAKALVAAAAMFAAGLVAVIIAVLGGIAVVHSQFSYVYPVTVLTAIRVVTGTALLIAVVAVLAVALGAILRRTAAAVTVAIVGVVLPYVIGIGSVLPIGGAQWLLRISPAAGFAIEQSIPAYPQVSNVYAPAFGYFPLAPWAGFAVLCGWAALALALAVLLIRRRDA